MSSSVTPARSRVPRLAEAAVARARLTVVPRYTQKAPRVPFLVLVSLLLVCGIGGLLWFNTSLQQASFTATALEQRAGALDAKVQVLQMDLAKLRSPQWLAERAKRLGMVPATSPAFIRLSDGHVLGKPQPAEASNAFRINPPPVPKPADLRPAPVVVKAKPATDNGAASTGQRPVTGRKNANHQRRQESAR